MLYLTSNDTGHEYLYRVFVSWGERKIVVGLRMAEYMIDFAHACIIDVDEQEACVLALKGFRLFKVSLVGVPNSNSYWYAIVDDIDAVIEWERETFYT